MFVIRGAYIRGGTYIWDFTVFRNRKFLIYESSINSHATGPKVAMALKAKTEIYQNLRKSYNPLLQFVPVKQQGG